MGECAKFRPEFRREMYVVTEVLNKHNLRLRNSVSGKRIKCPVHIDRIKKRYPTFETHSSSISKPRQPTTTTTDRSNRTQETIVKQYGKGDNASYLVRRRRIGKTNWRETWKQKEDISPKLLAEYKKNFTQTGKPRIRFKQTKSEGKS